PVDDVLMLELSEPQTLSIYNALGQLVGTNRTTEGINKIDCSHLNKGVYIIISNYGNIKFIKQ
ncbi:MAG: T9SS type A sorting domain-containing protein, partial [Bacteroidetes bacterium]|nr:T9SS type A sorting domain-containing protein [Bacteroidota bacterium]